MNCREVVSIIDSVSFLANLIDLYLLSVVAKRFCKRKSYNRFPALLAVFLAACLVSVVNIVFQKNKLVAVPISIVGMFLILSLVYKTKKEIFLSILIWSFITVCVEIFVILIFSLRERVNISGVYLDDTLYTVIAAFASKGIAYSVIFFMFRGKNNVSIARAFSLYQYVFFMLALLVLCNSTILFDRIIEGREISEYYLLYFFASVILMFAAVLYLFDRLIAVVKESEETKRINESYKAQQNFADEINTMTDNLCQLNHDYRHHLQTLVDMAEFQKNEEAYKYVQNVLAENPYNNLTIIKNSPVISLLLLQKKKQANANNIDFVPRVSEKIETNAPEAKINIILCNLLDNAFDAVMKLSDKREVILRIYSVNDMFFMEVSNTYDGELKVWNNQYISTKENHTNHGFGLKSIRRIIEELDGVLRVKPSDSIFEVVVSLPVVCH